MLGLVKFRDSIAAPFERRGDFHIKSPEEIEKYRMDVLRGQDTDNDSLNDYDELYVFRTSPFIEDSDSDGLLDGDEVMAGTDPNCPRTKTCRIVSSKTEDRLTQRIDMDKPLVSSGESEITVAPDGTDEDIQAAEEMKRVEKVLADTFGDLTKVTPQEMTDKIDSMTGDQLRKFLMDIGLPAEVMEGKDDELLRDIMNDSLLEALVAAQEVEAGTEQEN